VAGVAYDIAEGASILWPPNKTSMLVPSAYGNPQ